MNSPALSVIIAARSAGVPSVFVRSPMSRDPRLEVLTAVGKNPSLQRNAAAAQARGALLYFIDDDTQPTPGTIDALFDAFAARPDVSAIGGPALCAEEASPFERLVWRAMGHAFGQARMSCRFRAGSRRRSAGEFDLIGCNWAIRRSAWQEMSCGFDARLYPNEENELINGLTATGHQMLFDPHVRVTRRFAEDFPSVWRRFFSYGRSRLRHYAIRPEFTRLEPLIPGAFVAYLAALMPLSTAFPDAYVLWGLPIASYMALCCGAALQIALPGPLSGFTRRYAISLGIFASMHLAYGAGLLFELARPRPHRTTEFGEVIELVR